MSKKLYIKTHGCQMNEYDSTKMVDVMQTRHGFEVTNNPFAADMILINTCSIREKAEEKVFSQLGMWRDYKEKNPKVVIGVGGCVASQEGEKIVKRAPYVDMVFGPQTLHRIADMYEEVLTKRKPVVDIQFPEIEKFDHLPPPRAEGPTAYVSIMEGCSKYCSYCVVPYTRGEEISRPFDDVLREVFTLSQQGVREIILLGQNVNDYRATLADGTTADLALLIHYIAEIETIGRIRFMTSHPIAFSDTLIEAYATVPKLANQLHLPVQSGNDRILAAMKRGYTVLEFKSKIRKLQKVRPDIKITSDFIVGFPGETEKEFMDTMNLIADIGFDNSFTFIYSPRPGTPAANLPDLVPMETKKLWLNRMQARLNQNILDISHGLLGSIQRILITGPSKKDPKEISGRTECNRVVNLIGPAELSGYFIDVRITEVHPYSLRGERVDDARY